jgi:integrase
VVLARILTALDRGWVDANPCERGGRLYSRNRRDKIWTVDDELAFLEKAPQHLHLPLTLALWTGQRQGDRLRLTWSAYNGNNILLRRFKTGARVSIPVGSLQYRYKLVDQQFPNLLRHNLRVEWATRIWLQELERSISYKVRPKKVLY